jgi:hypothetical protein
VSLCLRPFLLHKPMISSIIWNPLSFSNVILGPVMESKNYIGAYKVIYCCVIPFKKPSHFEFPNNMIWDIPLIQELLTVCVLLSLCAVYWIRVRLYSVLLPQSCALRSAKQTIFCNIFNSKSFTNVSPWLSREKNNEVEHMHMPVISQLSNLHCICYWECLKQCGYRPSPVITDIQ